MKLYDLLRRGAATSPDAAAITHGNESISFRDLMIAADRLKTYFEHSSLERGSRIGILYDNSVAYVIAFFAVTGAGFIPVPLDTSLKPEKFRYILDDCGAKALIIQAKFTRHIETIVASGSAIKLVISDRSLDLSSAGIATMLLSEAMTAYPAKDFDRLVAGIENILPVDSIRHDAIGNTPHELAAIYYTSGSTGEPKGVMLSHRNLVSNTLATIEYLELTAADAVIVILPFYYIYGNSLLLTHVAAGGRLVIDNRFAYPQVILETMAEEKVTGFSGVPSNFMILLNNPNFGSTYLPALRYLTQAGGGMAPEVIRRVMAAFPDKQIFIMYGQTEASPRISYLSPRLLADHVGSIGVPVPGVTIRVADERGEEVPTGQVGEIIVFGDCVMMGYWNQPEEEAQVLKNGWLYTGDLARRDEKGLLYVVSRKKEIMKVGGNRVSAREVEEKILEHGKVQEVAVIPVPDEILGEAIKAFIVPKPGQEITAGEITNFCKASMAMHKVPKFIRFVDRLPKHQSGKVNKQALAEYPA